MLSILVYILPFLVIPVGLFSLVNTVTNLRLSRKAPYFRIRQQAAKAGWRWMLTTIIAGIGFALALYARDLLPAPDFTALLPRSAETTVTPTFDLMIIDTMTPDSALIQEPIEEMPPTITPTAPPSTETATPPIVTIQSNITPPPGLTVSITDISADISSGLQPVNPGTTFPVGIQRIYVFFEYQDMINGLSWSRVLRYNNDVVRSESEEWTRGSEGTAYDWFNAQGGWPGGSYEILLFVGDRLVASQTFSIID